MVSDIEKLNQLTPEMYEETDVERNMMYCGLRFYFNGDKLIIVGMADSEMYFWLSVTDVSDRPTTAKIFNRVIFGPCNCCRSKFRMPESERLDYMYNRSVLRSKDGWSAPIEGLLYPDSEKAHMGQFFADDVIDIRKNVGALAKMREDGGAYLNILKDMLPLMKKETNDPVADYEKVEPLIDILRNEDFLYCSENPEVHDTYVELRKLGYRIYCRWMTATR